MHTTSPVFCIVEHGLISTLRQVSEYVKQRILGLREQHPNQVCATPLGGVKQSQVVVMFVTFYIGCAGASIKTSLFFGPMP